MFHSVSLFLFETRKWEEDKKWRQAGGALALATSTPVATPSVGLKDSPGKLNLHSSLVSRSLVSGKWVHLSFGACAGMPLHEN